MSTVISGDRLQSFTATRTEGRGGVSFLEGDWRERLAFVVEMVREVSQQTDPQVMVNAYGKRMRQVMPSDAFMSLSRRNLPHPRLRITRSSRFAGAWYATLLGGL